MAIIETRNYSLADSFGRMALGLRIKDQKLGFNSSVSFIVDTGASCVLLPSTALYLDKRQEDLIKSNSKVVGHCGISTSKRVIYYRYFVSEFSLGKIVFKDFPIHITFEEDATMKLLGMPFLKMFNMTIQPQKQLITFSALPVTEKIIISGMSVKGIESVVTANAGAVDDIMSQLQG